MIDWLRMIEEGDALLVKIIAVLRIRAGEKALTTKESHHYKLFCDFVKIGTSYHLNNMVCKEHKKMYASDSDLRRSFGWAKSA